MKREGFLISIFRIILGLTFVVSASLKAIDPVGTTLKIREYFATLASPLLDSIFDIEILSWIAYLLILLEFAVGLLLLMRLLHRLTFFLLISFLLFFSLITGYIYFFDKNFDCGCFGEAIKLSSGVTFSKNLLFLLLAIVCYFRDVSPKAIRIKYLTFVTCLLGLVVFIYGNITHLPLIDFRPYKIGCNIRERIEQIDQEYQSELKSNIRYIYEQEGVRQSFHIDSLPIGSSWSYVTIEEKDKESIRSIEYDFQLIDEYGIDKTKTILNYPGVTYLFTISKPNITPKQIDEIRMLNTRIIQGGGKSYLLSSIGNSQLHPSIEKFLMDATTLKTMIRSDLGLIVLKDGVIIDKLSYADFPKNLDQAQAFVTNHNDVIGVNYHISYWRLVVLLLSLALILFIQIKYNR